MAKQVIVTRHAAPIYYSQGIKTEQFIFVAGMVALENPDTGEKLKDVEAQTRQSLEFVKETLETAGSSLNDVVSTTVYLTNRDDYPKMNEVYKAYFPKEPPARATLIVAGLVRPEMLVEIQCIACCSSK